MVRKTKSSLSSPEEVLEWLSVDAYHEESIGLFYHADTDGCVSAAYWSVILSKLGFRTLPRKVRTSELSFESVGNVLKQGDFKCAVFLDLPAGTQFQKWYNELPKSLRIFVYDHHDVGQQIINFPPRFVQYASDRAANLPPACLFSQQAYEKCLKSKAEWLVYTGLIGEGQISRHSEYVINWPFAEELVTLIAHGVLRKDNLALEYLIDHLHAGLAPPASGFDDKAQELRQTSSEIADAINVATEQVLGKTNTTLIAELISAKYQIANYVASKARHSWPNSLMLVGEFSDNDNVRAELRIGRNVNLDLRPIVRGAKECGILLGGGGHPSAVGVRLKANNWQPFIDFVNRKIG